MKSINPANCPSSRKRNEHIRRDPKYEALWSKYVSHRKRTKSSLATLLLSVVVVSPSERMKLKSALKKWISANAGLSGVRVDSTHIEIR